MVQREHVVFRVAYGLFVKQNPRGIMVALAWVGQRDTKWLIPLTVSAVTRVRKVTALIRRYRLPTTVAPFILRLVVALKVTIGILAKVVILTFCSE